MNIYTKFAVNKSQGEVQLIEGKVKIPVGGWKGLTAKELEHEDIVYALRRDWIELVKDAPSGPETPEKLPLTFVSSKEGGSTEPPKKTEEVKSGVETTTAQEIPADRPKRMKGK